ncbi:FixH family protein [Mesobacillus maritimus]|uniref:FixH family protein n=1 Tax=Mesobacillus maritimus TaxID=1643336 RepID=A0ABS7K5E3_9BACI|nr:FixH family protein [Mesobacillus maritimus]MBY0097489.1 FixH family protein [Mesobacillus maritimus]
MNKWSILGVILLTILLSACSSKPSWEVEITKDPAFLKGKTSTIEIEITEDAKPVNGVEATAQFTMVEMDHGTLEVTLEEDADGKYAGHAEFPMAGKYEAVFFLVKDGQEVEKVIELDVEKAAGVASINGEWITEEDVDFYRFINTLHIEMARETDSEKYSGEELEEAMNYWDSQEEMNNNQNTLVAQIIRLRAMAMLGEEKGHQATEEEVQAEVEKVRSQYEESKAAKRLIAEYGEDKFWKYQEAQYQKIVLTQKVQADVIELVKKDSPEASDQEVRFTAEKKYEELLVSQVDSLEIELL